MEVLSFKEIKYAYLVTIIPNFALLIYTSFKLIQMSQKSSPVNNDRLYGNHRLVVFSLIFLGSLSRILYEVDQLLQYYSIIKQSMAWDCVADILDNLPTVLFISLASFFSNSWHKHYTSYENSESSNSQHKMYVTFLFLFNALMYVINIALIIGYWRNNNLWLLSYFHASFVLALVIVTIAIVITGRTFHSRTLNFVNYAGRSIKSSSGFKRIYSLLIICCLLKCLDSCLNYYLIHFVWSESFNEQLFKTLAMGSVLLFDAFAEPAFFFGLISLLNASASKCQTFLSEGEGIPEKSFQTSFQSQELSLDTH